MILDWTKVRMFVKPGATDRDCCTTSCRYACGLKKLDIVAHTPLHCVV
jgi:hypothetical protein